MSTRRVQGKDDHHGEAPEGAAHMNVGNVLVAIATVIAIFWLGSSSLRRAAAPPPSLIDEVEHLITFEDAALTQLPPHALQKSVRYDVTRDGVSRFERVMTRRYDAFKHAEEASGGLIDLVKSGLQRKTRDDVVEWRFLRNHRRRPGGPNPIKWLPYTTHPMLAAKHLCDDENRNDFGNWRHPHAPGLFVDEVTPYTLVRSRIQMSQFDDEDERFLSRPTALCVSTVSKPSRLHLALHQYRLWGRYCDDFWIVVPRLPSDVIAGTDYEAGFTIDTAKADARLAGFNVENIKFVEVSVVLQMKEWQQELAEARAGTQNHVASADDDAAEPSAETRPNGATLGKFRDAQRRRAKWQIFRDTIRLIDGTSRSQYFEHVFFVDETVYAIPENLYSFLSEPQTRLLHELGTPLWMGNRMTLPPPSEGPLRGAAVSHAGKRKRMGGKTKAAAVVDNLVNLAAAAGVSTLDGTSDLSTAAEGVVAYAYGSSFVLNLGAIRLLASRLPVEDCLPHASLAAVDIALAMCFAPVGVYPRDTSDNRGADRFLIHSLQSLARQANSAAATAGSWYAAHRPRAVPQGFAVLSPFTISLPMFTTVEDMSTVHAWVFELGGAKAWL